MFTIVVVIGCYASFVVSWNGLLAKTNLYVVEKDVAATRLNGFAKAMGLGFPFQVSTNDLQTYSILVE